MDNFNRESEYKEILSIIKKPAASFFYVRGRRRVGKSWLLKKLAQNEKNTFYYMGAKDHTSTNSISDFIIEWEIFSKTKLLSEIKTSQLNWKRVFDEITNYVENTKTSTILIFDEVQWIAKEGSGFIGRLKEAWIDLEKSKKAKIIVCGSSNKFFHQHTGGEEVILRGMKTHADLIIHPLPLKQCHLEYFKNWNKHEIAMAFMMTGGVPYYLKQINPNKSFITAINDSFFCKDTIFLEEVDEVLRLDFNKQGIKTVKNILAAIGPVGAGQSTIIKKTKIPDSTVSEILMKLEDYNIVELVFPSGTAIKGNRNGGKYLIKDFYLNTYFSLIAPLSMRIKKNSNSLLFANEYLKNNSSFYIENYSGHMFEKIIRNVLELRNMNQNIFSKLELRDENYIITQYWDKENQIDLIVEHPRDRISRAIEIKWLNDKRVNIKKIYEDLELKDYPIPRNFTRQNFIAVSTSTKPKTATETTIILDDLF
jgi:AAA+ ATPase superfamily predicted ATPase